MFDVAEMGLKVKSDDFDIASDRMRRFRNEAGGAETAMKKLARVAGTLAGAFVGAFAINKLVTYADAWSDMQSKVGAAVKNMEAAPRLMRRMVDIANASYSPLAQTVESYSSNVTVLRDLGYTADATADFTEALNHALVVTATKGERATSVQNALSKAMAIGKLTGDGLETVLANGGRVAEALAKELGTTINGLRGMASEGKITSAVIAGALIGSLETLRTEAGAMPATIADGLQRIGTGVQYIIGVFDQITGISGTVAAAFVKMGDVLASVGGWMADNAELVSFAFDNLAGMIIAAGIAAAVYYTPAILGAVTATGAWVLSLITLRGALMATGIGVFIVAGGILIGHFLKLVEATGGFGNAIKLLGDVAREVWGRMGDYAEVWQAKTNAVWAEFKAGGLDVFSSIVEGGIWFANRYVGIYRGAFQAIKVIWEALPSAIGNAVVAAVNATITAIENMIKKVAGALDDLTSGIANSWVGQQMGLSGTSLAAGINLGRVPQVAGSIGPKQTAGAAFEAGFNTDTFDAGGATGGMRGTAAQLREQAAAYREATAMLQKNTEAPLTAWQQLMAVFTGTSDAIDQIGEDAAGTTSELDGMGNAGAGAAAKVKDAVDSLKKATEDFKGSLSSAFTGLVTGAQTLTEAIGNVIQKLAEMAAQKAFEALWAGGGESLVSSLLGAMGFARGGVFDQGRVTAFASGGVVNKPTNFPMRNGTGLMGEAGPEAIIPLSRGSDGKLGVQSAGGGPQKIQMTVEVLENGNIRAIARDEAGQVVAEGISAAAPQIVAQSVKATGRAMQSTKAFGS